MTASSCEPLLLLTLTTLSRSPTSTIRPGIVAHGAVGIDGRGAVHPIHLDDGDGLVAAARRPVSPVRLRICFSLLDSLELQVDHLRLADAAMGLIAGPAFCGVSNSKGLFVKLPTQTRPLWSMTFTGEAK